MNRNALPIINVLSSSRYNTRQLCKSSPQAAKENAYLGKVLKYFDDPG